MQATDLLCGVLGGLVGSGKNVTDVDRPLMQATISGLFNAAGGRPGCRGLGYEYRY